MEEVAKNKYTKEDIDILFKDELKNHYIKREISVGNNIQDIRKNNIEREEEKIIPKTKNKFKYKLMVKVILALIICLSVVGYKYIDNPNVKNNKLVNWIKAQYNKNYSRIEVVESIEEISKNIYSKIPNILPNGIYNRLLDNYLNTIKPEILNFDITDLFKNNSIENTVTVFNEDTINLNTEDIALAEEVIVTSSAVSLMELDKEEILKKNINIIMPVNGTITSIYGAREEVFKNVGYHTGLDIANVLNTPIKSATVGTVVAAEKMDKYYGNNIQIENNGVIFQYAHLNQINVAVGDTVNQGDIIGLMGSTGASTGSHLHFEIRINGRTVDPQLLVK